MTSVALRVFIIVVGFIANTGDLLAQDRLVFYDNSIKEVEQLLITDSLVEYKLTQNPDGPLYQTARINVLAVIYEVNDYITILNKQDSVNYDGLFAQFERQLRDSQQVLCSPKRNALSVDLLAFAPYTSMFSLNGNELNSSVRLSYERLGRLGKLAHHLTAHVMWYGQRSQGSFYTSYGTKFFFNPPRHKVRGFIEPEVAWGYWIPPTESTFGYDSVEVILKNTFYSHASLNFGLNFTTPCHLFGSFNGGIGFLYAGVEIVPIHYRIGLSIGGYFADVHKRKRHT